MSTTTPRIVLVAATTGYQTRMFHQAALDLRVELTLATDRCHILEDPWADRAVPIRFADPEDAAAQIPECDGILGLGDRPALVAAIAAERLGIPFHPAGAVRATVDKALSRARFAQAGLPVPETFSGEPRFPCVVKPRSLSASRGVIRANNRKEFEAAVRRIEAMLPAPEPLQVESFIPGREFALEGIVSQGRLHLLALFDKPDPLDGPFFEETIYVTPSRETNPTQAAILETTKAAARALGLSHGPVHAEMRVNERGVFMLEIAARPIGGLCARALRYSDGMSLEELLLRHALGHASDRFEREREASGVMMIPIPRGGIYQGVEGLEAARATPGISDAIVTAKIGQHILPLPEGASYLGFLFARGAAPDEVENSLRVSHSRLRFQIATALNVV